jgi:ankyrin repeat protein
MSQEDTKHPDEKDDCFSEIEKQFAESLIIDSSIEYRVTVYRGKTVKNLSLLEQAVVLARKYPHLLENLNVEEELAKTNGRTSALIIATTNCEYTGCWVVKKLIDAGINVDISTEIYENPLCVACRVSNCSECVKMLIDVRANVNYIDDPCDRSPLISAVSRSNDITTKMLIEAGAHVNHRTRDGFTACIEAAENKDISCLKLLIEAGACLSDEDYDIGVSPLGNACRIKHIEAIELLLDSDAPISDNNFNEYVLHDRDILRLFARYDYVSFHTEEKKDE